jgi:hypothetical protein
MEGGDQYMYQGLVDDRLGAVMMPFTGDPKAQGGKDGIRYSGSGHGDVDIS